MSLKEFFSKENISEKIGKYRTNLRKSIHHRGHRVDRDKLKKNLEELNSYKLSVNSVSSVVKFYSLLIFNDFSAFSAVKS